MHRTAMRWMTWLTLLALCLSLFSFPVLAAEEFDPDPVQAEQGQSTEEEQIPLVNVILTEEPADDETAGDEPAEEIILLPDDEPAQEPAGEAGGDASGEASEDPAADGDPELVEVTYLSEGELLMEEIVAVGKKPVLTPTEDNEGRRIRAWLDEEGNLVVPGEIVIEGKITFIAWYGPALETVLHNRYINGIGNAKFGPTQPLTRAQAATILYQLLNDQKPGPFKNTFSDVSDKAWYAAAVTTLASIGVINGYTDGTFKPNRSVTRAEFVTMLVNLTGVTGGAYAFTDVGGHWAKNAIAAAASQGWINGYKQTDGTYKFKPGSNITRAEAVVVMNRVLGRHADRLTIDDGEGIRHFIDVRASDWWFYDVMEASIGHNYTETDEDEIWGNYTVEKTELAPGIHKIGSVFVLCDANQQPVHMNSGLTNVDGAFYYTPADGWTFEADLSSKPGYAVFASGLTDQKLTNGFNQINTTLFYWNLTNASAMALVEGLNQVAGKTYWADADGYVIRNDFHAGTVELGGKKYLADNRCAIITKGTAYVDDTSEPVNTDLRNKTFEHEGNMYYIQDDYSLAADKWIGYLYFDKDGHYTSGDKALDAMVYDLLKDFIDNNVLTHEKKLLRAYYILRGGSGANYVDNGFRYLPVGNIFYKGRYNEQAFNGYFIDCAKQMYTKNYGRCFEWGAGYLYLARRLGFQAYLVVGGIGSVSKTHCWNMIQWSGKWHISDVEIEWGWLAGYYGGGYKLYRNLFDQTVSSEWIKYYVNPETSSVSYFFPEYGT